MESNLSAIFDETNQSNVILNSTAFHHDSSDQSNRENEKEWKLSPIPPENHRQPIFKEQSHNIASGSMSSSHKTINSSINHKTEDVSGYESKSTVGDESSKLAESSLLLSPRSRVEKLSSVSMSADLSSYLANKSICPFDSLLMSSLHRSINFSPRLVLSQEKSSGTSEKDGDKFQWSVEQLAILKPAHISEDEIAASYHSPNPEIEDRIQEALNEYWSSNVSYIPSPDGPRYVHLPHRDGRTTTIKYSSEGTVTTVQEATPSLCDQVRKKQAMKAAYATSSPKHRPKRNVRQIRNRTSQTEFTIPPNVDVDFQKILGDSCVYDPSNEDENDGEEVFDVSMCSTFSMRRRLFSANEEEGEDANVSMVSCDNLNESQRFNDSLSPVRRDETETENVNDDQNDENGEDMNMSVATRSHVSQIAINTSILNDCMMQSMCHEDEDGEKENEKNDENDKNKEDDGRIFHNDHLRHMHKNEFEALDESSSSNATPRHEDLDWTPRRIGAAGNATGTPHFRKFLFECSPIHPGKILTPKSDNS